MDQYKGPASSPGLQPHGEARALDDAGALARIPLRVRLVNAVLGPALRLGLEFRPVALLTVRGRRTGRPRTTPIGLLVHDGRRYLFSAFGEVGWVRNLRASGEAVVTHGRRRETLRAAELSAEEAAPVLQSLLKAPIYGAAIRPYFPVAPDAPLTVVIREAQRHPVFELALTAEPTSSENTSSESRAEGSRGTHETTS